MMEAMILETIPELQRLTPRERLILAAELMGDFQDQPADEFDEAVAQLAAARMKYYEEHPESGKSWDDLRRSIGKV
jgi:putative addiction module component (TIGR02574 family)